MPKDETKNDQVAGPQGGGASPQSDGAGEDAATEMLEVPPGGFPEADAAFSEDDQASSAGSADDDDTPPVMWVNPNKKRSDDEGDEPLPDIMEASDLGVVLLGTGSHDAAAAAGEEEEEDGGGGATTALNMADIMAAVSGEHAPVATAPEEEAEEPEAATMALNVEEIMKAASGIYGSVDAAEEPEEPVVVGAGPELEDEEEEEGSDAPTMALNVQDILAASGQYAAAQEAAEAAGAGSEEYVDTDTADLAAAPVGDEDEEDSDAPTMALNVQDILAASGQYAAAQEEDEEDEDEAEEGAATMALSMDQILAAAGQASGEAAAADEATVMLEVGAGADAGAEATVMLDVSGEADPGATVMLDTSAEADPGATTMLDTSGGEDLDDAFKTVMLDTSAGAEDAESEATVMLDVHEAKISAEFEPVEEAGGAVKMGAAAKDKGLFEDGVDDIEDIADEESDFTADPRMSEEGDLIGERYRLGKLVGQGGFAVVFLGEDEAISGKVAIKVLQAEKSVDPEFAQRFQDEVKVVRHLQHPNTIKISDVGKTDSECLYMVMEFVEGEELDNVIKTDGAMDPARTVHIGRQILRSLAEAHEKGIVHRDLKPQNVMLTEMGGEKDFVKVLDFGIAKALEADLTQAQTKTGVVFCTPRYAPPEILTGRRVSAAADVYACGLMMSELLAGNPVIAAPSDAESIAYQLSPQPVPIPPEILGTPLGEVLQKATEKDVDKRYQNAGEMLEAIEKIGQEHLPTVPLLISSANPTLTGQIDFESTLKLAGVDATMRVGKAAAPVQKRTPVAAIAAGLLALAAAVALIVIVTSQPKDTGTESGEVVVTTPEAGGGDETQSAAETPRGPSARDVLAARLAASDWEAGSWLGEEEEERPRRHRRVRVLTRNEETGEEAVQEFDIPLVDAVADAAGTEAGTGGGADIALVGGTGQGTGGGLAQLSAQEIALIQAQIAGGTGEGTGGGLAILAIDTTVVEEPSAPEADTKLESERVAALYQSVQASTDALNMLDDALAQGAIEEEAALQNRIFLTQNMVQVLTNLDRCDAAERRLDTALEEIGEVPPDELPYISEMRLDIETCRERVAARENQWDPTAYRAQLRAGQEAYDEAQTLPDEDLEGRNALLFQSLTSRQEAIGMLESALQEERVPEQHREAAGRDLAHLNQLVMVTMYDLDLNEAAQVQSEQMADQAELLPEDAQAEMAVIAVAMQEDEIARQQEEDRLRNEALAAQQAALAGTGQGTGSDALAAVDGTGTGTGALAVLEGTGQAAGTGSGAPVAVAAATGVGFSMDQFQALVAQSSDLFEEAQDVEIEIARAEEVAEAEHEAQLAAFAAQSGCSFDADCEVGLVCLEGSCQVPPGPPVYTVRVLISSDPGRVRVMREGEVLGRTPFDQEIISEAEEIVLTLRKTDYETEELTIPMTLAADFSAEVEMELRNVFGRTQTLSERLRERRRDR